MQNNANKHSSTKYKTNKSTHDKRKK